MEPTYGTKTAPTPDGNSGTNIITMNSYDYPIIDDNLHKWTIADSQVVVDGVIDQSTRNVTELAYVNGRVWQQNSDTLWWSKTSPTDSWDPPSGQVNTPIPGINRTWDGGSALFSWGDNWSSAGVPQAGEFAVINQGTVNMDAGYGVGVNFKFGGGELEFEQNGGYLLGVIQGTGTIRAESPVYQFNGPQIAVSIAGASLQPGDNMVISDFQYSAQYILSGNSGLTGASLIVAQEGLNHVAYAPIQNNGIMFLDGSTFKAGTVSGNGSLLLVNGSSAQIASGSETLVNLTSGALELGGSFNPPGSGIKNLSGLISQFGDDSSVQVDGTQAFLEVVKHYSADAKELFLISPDNKVVADLNFYGGAQVLYASNNSNGSLTISAHDNGHSLPIIDV